MNYFHQRFGICSELDLINFLSRFGDTQNGIVDAVIDSWYNFVSYRNKNKQQDAKSIPAYALSGCEISLKNAQAEQARHKETKTYNGSSLAEDRHWNSANIKHKESCKEGNHKVNHSINISLGDLVKANTAGAASMSTSKLTTLKAFAGKTEADEYKNLTSLPESVKEALSKKILKQQEASAEAAADQIISLLKTNDSVVETHVEAIRSLRKRVEREKAILEKVNAAKNYAMETNNYIPLAAVLGQLRLSELDEAGDLAKVPEGWVPAATTTA